MRSVSSIVHYYPVQPNPSFQTDTAILFTATMKRTSAEAFGTVAGATGGAIGGAAGASTASPSRMVLNVGGVRYTTTRSTLALLPDTMLGRMFSDADGHDRFETDDDWSVFIDRNGRLFEWVLDAHRNGGKCTYPADATESDRVHAEYVYFGLADPCAPSPATLARIMAQPLAKKDEVPRTVPDRAILRCVFGPDVVSALVQFFRENRCEVQVCAGVDSISFRGYLNSTGQHTIEATSCLTWDFHDDVMAVALRDSDSLKFHDVDEDDEDVAAAFAKFDGLQAKDDARCLVRLDVFTTCEEVKNGTPSHLYGIQLHFYPTGDANSSFYCACSWTHE